MSQATLTVFDPALCCSTGVCGPNVDEQLVRFAADLSWLKALGVAVQRLNLSQEPGAFAQDVEAKATLQRDGVEGLPLVKVDGVVKSSGRYPTRLELAEWTGVGRGGPSPAVAGGCCAPAKTQQAPSGSPAPEDGGSSSTGCCQA